MIGPFTSRDGTYVGLPPWVEPPKDAHMFERTQSRFVLPSDGETSVLSFDVPAGVALHVHAIGMGARDGMGTMLGVWSLKKGGKEVEGYHYLPCSIGSLDAPARVQAEIPGGTTFEIVVVNNANVSGYTYVARAFGWLYRPAPGEVQ